MKQQNKSAVRPTVLRGAIQDLRTRKERRSAVFSPTDETSLQLTAVASAAMGLGAMAIGLSASSEYLADEGDLMTFQLNGASVEAWVWHSEFADADEVEVVAENIGGKWIGFAVRRLSDGLLAVHPHCERGSRAFYIYAFKLVGMLYGGGYAAVGILGAIFTAFNADYRWSAWFSLMAVMLPITGIMAAFITWRVTARFVKIRKLADRIFEAYGWRRPEYINLPRDSDRDRRPNDTFFLGVSIFRYNPK